jgi:hypothetical protein
VWLTLKTSATAFRNFQFIQSQERVAVSEEEVLQKEVSGYFPEIAQTDGFTGPYSSESYRRLPEQRMPYPHGDALRHFLCSHLSVRITYSRAEKELRRDCYDSNIIPRDVSPAIENLARTIIAMLGASSILVPMVIMSFHRSRTEALVTTSIAVALFATCYSLTFRTPDQTIAAIVGYAAILMVFVGLTT